jgi:hypothetical protein
MRLAPRYSTVAAALLASFSATAVAQDLQYKEVTNLDMGGVMNFMMRLARASEITTTTWLKGSRMRSDVDKSSTIVDFENRRFITLDHGAKTYTQVPLEKMAELARATIAGMQARMDSATAGRAAGQPPAAVTARGDSGTVDFKFDLKVEPTNERQRINGQDARRHLITITTDMSVTPEGDTTQQAGTLVMLIDSWNATSGPVAEAHKRFYEASSKELQDAMAGSAMGVSSLMMGDPRMRAALEEAAEQANQLEGVAVRSTTYLVAVPVGVTFDQNLVLNPEPRRGNPLGAAVARGVLGRAVGVSPPIEDKPADDKPRQGTVLKLVTEIRDVQTRTIPASQFEVPAGYREVQYGVTPGTGDGGSR